MNLNEWRPEQQPRSLLHCAGTEHTIACPGCGASKYILAVASPYFPTRSKKAKCCDKEAKLPKTQRIVQDVDGSCIAVTAVISVVPMSNSIR